MFLDNGINFIKGDHKSFKTTLLYDISKHLHDSGKRLLFIGGTNEKEEHESFLRIFNYSFFNSNFVGDRKIFDIAYELRENYDYIIIDDIDYINDTYIELLFKTNKPIICTCLTWRVYFQLNYPYLDFFIENGEIKLQNGDILNIDGFIKRIKREDKINLLLNDKG